MERQKEFSYRPTNPPPGAQLCIATALKIKDPAPDKFHNPKKGENQKLVVKVMWKIEGVLDGEMRQEVRMLEHPDWLPWIKSLSKWDKVYFMRQWKKDKKPWSILNYVDGDGWYGHKEGDPLGDFTYKQLSVDPLLITLPSQERKDRAPAQPGYKALTTLTPNLSQQVAGAVNFMGWLIRDGNDGEASPIGELCQHKEMKPENTAKTIAAAAGVFTLLEKFAAALPGLFYNKPGQRNQGKPTNTTAS